MLLAHKIDVARYRRSEDPSAIRSQLRLVHPAPTAFLAAIQETTRTEYNPGIMRQTLSVANRALAIFFIIISFSGSTIAGYVLGTNDAIMIKARAEVAELMAAPLDAPQLPRKWDRITGRPQ